MPKIKQSLYPAFRDAERLSNLTSVTGRFCSVEDRLNLRISPDHCQVLNALGSTRGTCASQLSVLYSRHSPTYVS